MTLLPGVELRKALQTLKENPDKTKVRETTLSLFKGMTEGLAHLHSKNVIHRDPHNGNWMVVNDEVYLIDMGMAKYLPNGVLDPLNETDNEITPFAYGPEAYTGKYSFNADVFSIACWFGGKSYQDYTSDWSNCFSDIMGNKDLYVRIKDPAPIQGAVGVYLDPSHVSTFRSFEAMLGKVHSLPKFGDKFGPELEQLLADMLIFDPAKRPQSAEVSRRAKLLK